MTVSIENSNEFKKVKEAFDKAFGLVNQVAVVQKDQRQQVLLMMFQNFVANPINEMGDLYKQMAITVADQAIEVAAIPEVQEEILNISKSLITIYSKAEKVLDARKGEWDALEKIANSRTDVIEKQMKKDMDALIIVTESLGIRTREIVE